MMQTFPFNYFSQLRSPKRIFAGRKQLSWPKFSFIFLFFVSLMVMPITMYYTRQVNRIPLEQFLTVNQLIDQEGVTRFSELKLSAGELKSSPMTIYHHKDLVIGGSLSKEIRNKNKTYINFEKNHWTIQQKEADHIRRYQMNYQSTFQPKSIRTPEAFQSFLEQEFYLSNRPTIILSYSISLGVLLFVMTALLLFGASFFLWMTRKSQFSSIQSFKESANLMLQVIGIGSIAATFIGFIHFNLVWMLGIQSTIAVLLLLWIFAKTGFKDEIAEAHPIQM